MNMTGTTKSKKKYKSNRHVYITERIRYFGSDVPTVDVVIEEDKLTKALAKAQVDNDWKGEAQALMKLGQLMKWRGQERLGNEFLAKSAAILRHHTFEEVDADDEE